MLRDTETFTSFGLIGHRKSVKTDRSFLNGYNHTLIGVLIALGFWFLDSSIHFFIYREELFEVIPEDFNELWMRILIVSLIVFFGAYSDYFSARLIKREKQLHAYKVYNSMLSATHHILNNLLNQIQLIRLEAYKCQDFDQARIRQFDTAIDEAVDLIEKLSSIKQITDDNIRASVHPRK